MEHIGPYRLVDQLGRGGTAVVFRGVNSRGEVCAIKVLHKQTRVARERFLREAGVLADLSHPAIVPLRSAGEDQGRLYLAMPFYQGRSLTDRVQADGPLPAAEALSIATVLADGLAYAHAHGILHRDVKPDNVLLDLHGQARLTDFGLARRTDSDEERLSKTGALMGTPGFWAPEQAGSGATIGPRTDVYGLGATLYYMLTGAPPIGGATLVDIMRRVLDEPVVPPRKLVPGVDRELDRLVLRCLAKHPRDRFASAHDLREALGALGEGGGDRSPRRAGRWLVPVLSAGLGAGVILGVAALLGGRTPPAGPPATEEDDALSAALAAAEHSLELGDPTQALRELDAVLAPSSARAWSLRADALFALSDFAAAEAACEAALEIDPSVANLHLQRAQIQLERGTYDRALHSLSEAIACGAGARAELLRSRVRLISGDREGALLDLQRLTTHAPELRVGWERWLELCEDDGDARLDVLARALRCLPDDADFLRERAQLRLGRDEFAEALSDLEHLILGPQACPTSADYALLSAVRRELDDLQGSLDAAQAAVCFAPGSGAAWSELGATLYALERLDQARHALTHAHALDPGDLRTRTRLAQCALVQGDYEWCLRVIESALAVKDPGFSGPYVLVGQACMKLERWDEAERALTQALRYEVPLRSMLLGQRGIARSHLQRDAGALVDLQEAVLHGEGREDPALWGFLAASYANTGNHEQALSALQRAVELGYDDDVNTRENFARLYLALERWEQASVELAAVAEARPDDPVVHHELARTLARLGDWEGALLAAQRAWDLSASPSSARELARCLFELDRPEAWKQLLDEAIAKHPEDKRLRLMQIEFLARSGQEERASPMLDAYLERFPDDARVLANRGSWRYRSGDYAGALRDLERSIELEPRDPFARFNRGLAWIQQDHLVEGLGDMVWVLGVDPGAHDAWDAVGQVLVYLGRRHEAAALYESHLQANADTPAGEHTRGLLEALRAEGGLWPMVWR